MRRLAVVDLAITNRASGCRAFTAPSVVPLPPISIASKRNRSFLHVFLWRCGPTAHRWLVDLLAVLFVVFRIGYVMAYIGDQPTLRSTLWSLAFLSALGVFLSGLMPWL
jgi:hypothetical protein